MQTLEKPTIDQVLGTLDRLAESTRAHDLDRYLDTIEVAHDQALSDDQIRGAHDWGNRTSPAGAGWAPFDWTGTVRHV